MSYYALLVPAYIGHVNPMAALGRALQRRGHRVALVAPADAEPFIRGAGLDFLPICLAEFPPREWLDTTAQAGRLSGWRAALAAPRCLARFARGIIRDVPGLIKREGFDGLVMDQIAIGTEAVCAVTRMPMAVACNSLMLHAEPAIPPIVYPWPHSTSLWSGLRNLAGYVFHNGTGFPVLKAVAPYRRRHRLPWMGLSHINLMPPSLVQVAQLPAFLDFPRRRLPGHFHYTGPWAESAARQEDTFPWERLDGRPLIYASLGTLQNRLEPAYDIILRACHGLEAQLVLARGRKDLSPAEVGSDGTIVTGYAPQLALLKRASLVITHGGLNTTLEALAEGLPLVLLPITNDQPGVAARVQRVGAGALLPLKHLSIPALRGLISAVLSNGTFRQSAQKCAQQIKKIDGPARAAELIERAFTTRKLVLRETDAQV